MTEQKPKENDLAAEFRNLSKNLGNALRAAWESPERQKLVQDLESGLTELGTTIKGELENIRQSPAGQKVRTEAQELGQRIRSGEVEQKARSELVEALRKVNIELQKFISQRPGAQPGSEGPSAPTSQTTGSAADSSHQEVHPDDVDTSTHPTTSRDT